MSSTPPVTPVLGDVRAAAHRLIDSLPAGASWDDVMYGIYVRQCIDAGIAEADAGLLIDVNDIRKEYGLPPCE